ncbi:phage tail tape measure protein [Leuconostoc gasicomitatum]|uniref:phage tail tape measure protein n=1 Tax=Leuconostoc gasicomitatum TaxID=115778 RepID=UPI001CC71290|nr:phage tail tape measure protein [Leuconostoc gasicomitatum]MBZ5958137.1 phage tail tape measure protein [Leuconostoc gasicomitatum]
MVDRIQAEMATSIALDVIKATNSLKGLSDAVNSVKNAWKAQEAAAKSSGDYVKASEERYAGLGRQMDAQNNRINELKQRQQGLDTSTKDGAESFLKYEKSIQQANQQLASLEAQQQRAKSSMDYQKSGLAQLQNEYKQTNAVSDSYVNRLKAENKERQANIVQANSLKSSLSNLSQQYEKQSAELKRVESDSGIASEAYRKQTIRVNDTATNISKMKDEFKLAQREVNSANPYGFGRFSSGANVAYRATEKMGDGFRAATQKVKEFAAVGSLVALGLGAVAVKGVQAAAVLENSYVKTLNLATTGGEKAAEAQKNVNQMQKDGAKLSVEYGKSQFDIAEGYQELIKRGYSSSAALGSMRSELEASVASGDDFNNVLSVTSQVVDAYGLRVDDANKMVKNTKDVTNQLAYAADMTATDFQSMGKAMEYVGDSAHSAGIELSTTSSAIGILSNHGLEADKAGTGLRKVINSLTGAMADQQEAMAGSAQSADKLNEKVAEQNKKVEEAQDKLNKATEAEKNNTSNKKKSTKATDSASRALEKQKDALGKLEGKAQGIQANDMLSKLGISRDQLIDSNGHLKKMSEIMKVINDHTKDIKDDDARNNVFHALFGTTGMQAGIILAQNNDELEKLNANVKNAANGQGYVQNLAQKNMDTTTAKLAQLKSSMELIVNSIGASLLPSVSDFAVKLANALNSDKGQKQLKELSKAAGEVGRSIVNTIEFAWSHRSELVTIGETLAGIWAFKKISDAIGWVRTAIGTYKELNSVLKVTESLNAVGLGGGGKSAVAKVGSTTVGSIVSTGSTVAASSEVGMLSKLTATLIPALTKSLPYVGVLAGLGQAGYSAYNATKATNETSKRTQQGGVLGSLSGTAIGAGIGSLIAPGIGTAIGAALGGTAGTQIGNKFGKAYQEGFKESHPKSISAWLGDDWDAAYKNSSSQTMKKFSADYKSQIDKLNSSTKIKLDIDDKNTKQNQKKVEDIYAGLQKTIDNFYKNQEKDSKKNLDILVKNGIITQKQEDELLKKSQSNDENQKKSKQKLANDLKKTSENYYSDVEKIQSGSNKTLDGLEKKYGTNSKKYKSEQNKELEALHDKYAKDIVGIETRLNASVSKATQVASTKQEDILKSLSNAKKTIGLKQIYEDERQAKKNHDTLVSEAQKTRDSVVKSANSRYKDSVSAAEKEYYQNKDISKKQYDDVVKNARKQRDDTIDAGETQRKKTTKSADQQYGDILDKTENQRYNVTHKSQLQKDGVVGHLQSQKDTTTRLGREQSNTLSDWADKQKDNTTKSARDQRDGVSGALGTMWEWLKSGAESGLNGLFTPINIGIGTINSLLSAFGGPKKTIEPLAVRFATGTGYLGATRRSITKPTLAMLNDGTDSPETGNQEMLLHPNGKSELVQGTNVIRPLLPGTEVLNAKETAMMLSGGMSRFADGTGLFSKLFSGVQSAGSWVGNAVSNVWDGMKDGVDKFTKMFGFITDAAAHPIESLEKKFNPTRKADLGSVMNGLGDNVFFDTTKKQAKSWWSEMWSMAKSAGEGGSSSELLNHAEKLGTGKPYVWGAAGPDSFDCSGLVEYALSQMGIAFPKYSGDQYNASTAVSNPQSGDLVFFGPGGGDHVGIYAGNGKMYSAMSPGSTPNIGMADISSWSESLSSSPYRRVSGMKPEQESKTTSPLQKLIKSQTGGMFDWIKKFIAPLNDSSTGTSGDVNSWSGDVKKALSQLGLSTSGDMVNKILKQIQTESGGNASAIGGNDGLADGNATGLMQVKPGTFNAYALAGHGNIMNGYDNMLAGINYAKSRYGNDLSFLGQGHGYANGVITNHPHVANIAEGGMTEAVIPWDLSKKSRAMELLGETVTHFASNTISNNTTSNNGSDSNVLTDKFNSMIKQGEQVISLLLQLVQGQANPTPAVVSANQANDVLNKLKQTNNRSQLLFKG